jgi:hypothetical protein
VIFVRLFGRRGFLRDRHVLVRMSLVLAHGPEGLEFLRWKPWRMELDDENLDLPIQTSFFFIAISNYQKVLWNMANSSFFFWFSSDEERLQVIILRFIYPISPFIFSWKYPVLSPWYSPAQHVAGLHHFSIINLLVNPSWWNLTSVDNP